MRHIRTLILGLILIAAALPAAGAFGPADVQEHRLDNGLKVLLVRDASIPNIAYYTFFRVGSRNERPGLTGVSHFIEHMMFNGTAAIGPGEFDRRMEGLGGSNNAFTSEDITAYTDWFPAGGLAEMVTMEADRMRGISFVPEVFDSERGVVASERRMAVENSNDGLLDELLRSTAIAAHPYHWGVIGWMSDILNWRRPEVMDYFRLYYAPNNAVLVVVGDFEPTAALELVRRHYGDIPASPEPPPVTTREPEAVAAKRVLLRRQAMTPLFKLAFLVPGTSDADYFALQLLDNIMLEGESSRLYRRLVREEKLATAVTGGMPDNLDPNLFIVDVKPVAGADPARIEAVIWEELERVRREGVSAREYQKALNMRRAAFYDGLDSISGKALQLGLAEMYHGGWRNLFTLADRYRSVPHEQIQAVARKYLNPRAATLAVLQPE
ncbi:MAG TPA: pitrilysin family protein [Acidobacteriota bacterium]|jgi:zinc protease|nr:insulinase family protein [Acidobacteriota bacterium]HNR40358.1 pitrilysin family protein [Acidobacteriota bacterium]HNU02441.1 pitrilysin family protein [Acidobacteriota bacterium]HPB28604.1 pitrilysin family protein [Acidobacteriota bacterium]HQO26709.1 pitrilysin family protein [Acidobacteriota bacterium]